MFFLASTIWININYLILFGDNQKGCIIKYQLPNNTLNNTLQVLQVDGLSCDEYFKKYTKIVGK